MRARLSGAQLAAYELATDGTYRPAPRSEKREDREWPQQDPEPMEGPIASVGLHRRIVALNPACTTRNLFLTRGVCVLSASEYGAASRADASKANPIPNHCPQHQPASLTEFTAGSNRPTKILVTEITTQLVCRCLNHVLMIIRVGHDFPPFTNILCCNQRSVISQ